jgi:zinc transporter ZupT
VVFLEESNFFHFLSALFAFLGVIIAIILGFKSADMLFFLLPFAAGNFIYMQPVI